MIAFSDTVTCWPEDRATADYRMASAWATRRASNRDHCPDGEWAAGLPSPSSPIAANSGRRRSSTRCENDTARQAQRRYRAERVQMNLQGSMSLALRCWGANLARASARRPAYPGSWSVASAASGSLAGGEAASVQPRQRGAYRGGRATPRRVDGRPHFRGHRGRVTSGCAEHGRCAIRRSKSGACCLAATAR